MSDKDQNHYVTSFENEEAWLLGAAYHERILALEVDGEYRSLVSLIVDLRNRISCLEERLGFKYRAPLTEEDVNAAVKEMKMNGDLIEIYQGDGKDPLLALTAKGKKKAEERKNLT